MIRDSYILVIIILLFTAIIAYPQIEPNVAAVSSMKLKDTLYKLICTTTFNVNVVASMGPDGILLIDTGHRGTADTLYTLIKALGNGKVRCVVNTHSHLDHAGGNPAFHQEATIIAHENTWRRLSGSYYALNPISSADEPMVSFKDSLSIHFNGEVIRLIHLPDAHSDGDVIVHFTDSNIIVLGDMLFSEVLPFVDLIRGGNVEGYAKHIGDIIDSSPPGVKFIAGHGKDFTLDNLKEYHHMLTKHIELVKKEIEAGKNIEEILVVKPLKDWEYLKWMFMDTDQWTTIVYNSLAGTSELPSICQPVTEILMEEGIEKAIERYHMLKKEYPHDYNFGEVELNMLGYQLIFRERIEDAIKIFELNVEAYPGAFNTYDSLGEAYMTAGDNIRARKNYKKSLELNPANNNAVEKLKQLEGN